MVYQQLQRNHEVFYCSFSNGGIVFTIVKYKTETVVSSALYEMATYLTIENMLDWFDTGEHIVE